MMRSWTWSGLTIALLLLVAATIRLVDIGHPVDGHLREPQREIDAAGLVRALQHSEVSVFFPRPDWSSEIPQSPQPLPLQAWLTASASHVLGDAERNSRVISYVAALLGVWLFWRLARALLPIHAAEAALLLYAFSPLAIRTASLVNPAGLSLMLYLAALLAFVRWRERDSTARFVVTLVMTWLAVLVDPAAMHLLLIFIGLILVREGGAAAPLKRLFVLGAGAMAVLTLWYGMQWLTHTSATNLLNPPADDYLIHVITQALASVWRIGLVEVAFVWMPAGLILTWWGTRWWSRSRHFGYFAWWAAGLLLTYLISTPWSGMVGALSVHVYSLPLASLAVGLGFAAAMGSLPASFGATTHPVKQRLALALFVITLANQLALVFLDANSQRWSTHYADARTFVAQVPPGARVAVVGEVRQDPLGVDSRGDAAYYLYWMQRAGIGLAPMRQSVDSLAGLGAGNFAFLIAERRWLARYPLLADALRLRYSVVVEGRRAVLFSVR